MPNIKAGHCPVCGEKTFKRSGHFHKCDSCDIQLSDHYAFVLDHQRATVNGMQETFYVSDYEAMYEKATEGCKLAITWLTGTLGDMHPDKQHTEEEVIAMIRAAISKGTKDE